MQASCNCSTVVNKQVQASAIKKTLGMILEATQI